MLELQNIVLLTAEYFRISNGTSS